LAGQPEKASGGIPESGSAENLLLRTNAAFFSLASEKSVLEGRLEEAIARILEVGVRTLDLDRGSAWLLSGESGDLITLACTYDAGLGVAKATGTESPYRAPGYLSALRSERVLPITDVSTDPRVAEFKDAYRRDGKVVSTLDAPIYSEGILAGVICLERFSGPPREWSAEEQAFGRALADMFSVVVEARRRREIQEALFRLEEERKLILDHIEDLKADMVLLCAHGHGGMRDFFVGNLAQQVIVNGNTPVFFIRTAEHKQEAQWECRKIQDRQ
jgi:GAF domain-containing protein